MIFSSCFSSCPHLIYLPEHILDKKRMGVQYSNKRQKIVNWHKNGGFPVVSRSKGWNYRISNIEYTLITFLLLTVYQLFIWHIFKERVDRNVLNLGYGKESRYVLVGRQVI